MIIQSVNKFVQYYCCVVKNASYIAAAYFPTELGIILLRKVFFGSLFQKVSYVLDPFSELSDSDP